jgi:antitoxin component YwqK of YwqJK toxin-antitoxin module
MENGSIASIAYFSNGNKDVSKEYIEIYSGGTVVQNEDFKTLDIYDGRQKQSWKQTQDKGHRAEISAFCHALREGNPCPIPFEEIHNTTLATFLVLESIVQNGKLLSTQTT